MDITWILVTVVVLVVAVVVSALARWRSHRLQDRARDASTEERQILQSQRGDAGEADRGRTAVKGAMDLSRRTSRMGGPFV